MKDMVPKGTGNSRFLRSSIPENITHEELVALLRAGTFPVDFAGLNPDGIATQGSAYNKANVLPDSVCTSMGIATSSEPKDAFKKLLQSMGTYKQREKITTSKSWICPSGVYLIYAILCGGGGGGASGNQRNYWDSGSLPHGYGGGGGQGGRCVLLSAFPVTPGKSYSIVIGAGGAGGKSSGTSFNSGNPGSDGGTTKAFGFSVRGGQGGTIKKDNNTGDGGNAADGGSPGGEADGGNGAYGGTGGVNISGTGNSAVSASTALPQMFTDLFFTDWYGAGGGGGAQAMSSSRTGGNGGPHAGNGGSYTVSDESGTSSPGEDGEDGYGAGGGGGSGSAAGESAGNGGNGGSGCVIIYY